MRLAVGGPIEPVGCAYCGKATLDTTGAHASCCTLGEATRGHDAVRGVVYDFSCAADPLIEKKPRGLVIPIQSFALPMFYLQRPYLVARRLWMWE